MAVVDVPIPVWIVISLVCGPFFTAGVFWLVWGCVILPWRYAHEIKVLKLTCPQAAMSGDWMKRSAKDPRGFNQPFPVLAEPLAVPSPAVLPPSEATPHPVGALPPTDPATEAQAQPETAQAEPGTESDTDSDTERMPRPKITYLKAGYQLPPPCQMVVRSGSHRSELLGGVRGLIGKAFTKKRDPEP